MAAFEAEVGGGGVAVELVGTGDDVRVDGGHSGELVLGGGVVSGGCRGDGAEVLEPVESPFEGTDDAIGVAGGKGCLPGVHPLCIEPREH